MENLIGKTLSHRYRIDEFLGQGGMAEVYKAWDHQRATILALKLLREDLANDRIFLRRFQREAQTLARLQHPNIVRLFGIETDDLTVFMLMDYIDGTNLQTEIFRANGHMLSLAFINQVMGSVCSALHYAHQHRMVHCDIKPGNIMINRHGIVLLTDFGIARMTDTATSTMVGFGTPAYMAPELIRGMDPTPQSDIYSLGVVLYEMSTGGERPFTGDRAQTTGPTSEKVRWEHLNLVPPPPRQYNPKISSELDEAILRCLAKDPKMRFDSALDLLNCMNLETSDNTSPRDFFENGQHDLLGLQQTGIATLTASQTDLEQAKGSISQLTAQLGQKVAKRSVWILIGFGVILMGLMFSVLLNRSWSKDEEMIQSAILTTGSDSTLPAGQLETPEDFSFIELTQEAISSTQTLIASEHLLTATVTDAPTHTATSLPAYGIGDSLVNQQDAASMVFVPGGTFLMGSEGDDAEKHESPQHRVFLDAYWIYNHPVTNDQFAKFISATGYKTSAEFLGWSWVFERPDWRKANGAYWAAPDGIGSTIAGLGSHPVVHISYLDAETYCKWAGGRLPTEAEWEKAARGETGPTFPWGDGPVTDLRANYCDRNCPFSWADRSQDDGFDRTSPVGYYQDGASLYGAMDMAGNIWEWVSDWYSSNYYDQSAEKNPLGPSYGDWRVIRGGSWVSQAKYLRSSNRYYSDPDDTSNDHGFRCVIQD